MSVRCEHYLILGTNLEIPKTDHDEKYEEWHSLMFPWCGEGAEGKCGILWGGMGGGYILAGLCLQVGTYEDGFKHTSFGTEMTPGNVFEVEEWLSENGLTKFSTGISLHLLSHYH